MFMARKNLWKYTPHSEQIGCVGSTQKFVPHKSTKFSNFLDFGNFISFRNGDLCLQNINRIKKSKNNTTHTSSYYMMDNE